jgi:hypothetical protein
MARIDQKYEGKHVSWSDLVSFENFVGRDEVCVDRKNWNRANPIVEADITTAIGGFGQVIATTSPPQWCDVVPIDCYVNVPL